MGSLGTLIPAPSAAGSIFAHPSPCPKSTPLCAPSLCPQKTPCSLPTLAPPPVELDCPPLCDCFTCCLLRFLVKCRCADLHLMLPCRGASQFMVLFHRLLPSRQGLDLKFLGELLRVFSNLWFCTSLPEARSGSHILVVPVVSVFSPALSALRHFVLGL